MAQPLDLPLDLSALAQKLGVGDVCAVNDDMSNRSVPWPSYTALKSDQQAHVIETANRFFRCSVER